MNEISVTELMDLPRKQFIDRCLKWVEEFGRMEIEEPTDCLLHLWVVRNKTKCSRNNVPNTAICPICGNACCPDCMNHKAHQLSRVTGYLSTVSQWGAAKQQEFKDRQRHNISS